ncbi:ankyrin repeat domain-containing protein [Roseicella aerolata]|uniref:Ankyrin repeat domain-containing protein n=1 Tax=Roseicella aerolata TaxID=2883479 RepID=A0A9X1L6A7_9PROT|nr:ankyrin repeat domain-containing protein [Roseicella aerolata]MCB4820631.1 ankyrin repeat domain-containing protein [Roseicella aerolata]
MQDRTEPGRELDAETLAFAGRVFGHARGGQASELAELLRMGLPANLRNEKGDSLLMLAAYHGQQEAVRVLLEAGADPDLANDRGQTPLAAAAFKGAADVVRLLLEKGAAVDGRGEGGRTALMVAAMFDRTEILDLLLARGANPLLEDGAGITARAAAERMGAAGTAARLARMGG